MKGVPRAWLVGIVGAGLLAAALHYAWLYLTPFLIATLLAAVIDPLVNRLHGVWGLGRGPAVLLVLSAFLLLAAAGLVLITANVTADLERLLVDLPRVMARLGHGIEQGLTRIQHWLRGLPHPLDDVVRMTLEQASQGAAAGVRGVLGTLKAAPSFLFLIMVAGLATYFISRDRHLLWAAVLAALPRPWRAPVVRLRDEIFGGVLGMVRAQLSLVAVTGAATVLGLLLAGVPYSWLLGLAAVLLDLIPMIGPGGVLAPVALVYLAQGQLATALTVLGLWLALVVLRQWLEPHVLGTELGLHPLSTLAAVYGAVQIMGAAGFVLGPLVLIVVKAFFVVTVHGAPPRR